MSILEVVNIGFTLLCLAGCGRGTEAPVDIDNTFTAYTQAFDTVSEQYGIVPVTGKISIQFKEGLNAVANEKGACFPASLTAAPSIGIDKNLWLQSTESEKTALIFHELGHCVLNETHRPHSIMAATVLPGFTYEENAAEYNAELFEHLGE